MQRGGTVGDSMAIIHAGRAEFSRNAIAVLGGTGHILFFLMGDPSLKIAVWREPS